MFRLFKNGFTDRNLQEKGLTFSALREGSEQWMRGDQTWKCVSINPLGRCQLMGHMGTSGLMFKFIYHFFQLKKF